jgi:NhaP-type Na+/H+ or K+/H+ antiporter
MRCGLIELMGECTTAPFSRHLVSLTGLSFALYGFWGALLVLGIISNVAKTFLHRRLDRHTTDTESTSQIRTSSSTFEKLRQLLNRYLVIPCAFGHHHQRLLYGWAIPTRLTGIVVVSYWILNIILCGVNYRALTDNM